MLFTAEVPRAVIGSAAAMMGSAAAMMGSTRAVEGLSARMGRSPGALIS